MTGRADPRIAYALALLQECLRGDGAPAATAGASWTSDLDWLQSSTDVLTPWYPDATPSDPVAGPPPPFAAVWDAYFASVAQPAAGSAVDNAMPSRMTSGADVPPFALLGVLPGPSAGAADAAAVEAVVEALYRFLHAIGRADVPAAMEQVDPDYHAMEGDREITCHALRQQLEQLVDERRRRGLDVSLAQVPEPVAHPLGMLVKLTIQVDSRNAAGLPETLLLYRIAVFRQSSDGRWLLTALGSVD